eukprot:7434701-Pyramimonas_sp.AAC.1
MNAPMGSAIAADGGRPARAETYLTNTNPKLSPPTAQITTTIITRARALNAHAKTRARPRNLKIDSPGAHYFSGGHGKAALACAQAQCEAKGAGQLLAASRATVAGRSRPSKATSTQRP